MFEKKGRELSKAYLAELVTSTANDLLETLGLEFRTRLFEESLLTSSEEAMEYFIGIARSKAPKRFLLRLRTRESYLRDIPSEIRYKIEIGAPFSYDNKIMHTPLLQGRDEQLKYWEGLVKDFVTWSIGNYCKQAHGEDLVSFYYDNFGVSERINHPQRDYKGRTYFYNGTALPIDASTLIGAANESWHLGFRTQKGLHYDMDEVIEQTICGLGMIYARYKSLPTILKNLTVFNFPDEWIEEYSKIMLFVPSIGHNEIENKAVHLFEKMRDQVDGNLKDGLALMNEAIAEEIQTYTDMHAFLERRNQLDSC